MRHIPINQLTAAHYVIAIRDQSNSDFEYDIAGRLEGVTGKNGNTTFSLAFSSGVTFSYRFDQIQHMIAVVD